MTIVDEASPPVAAAEPVAWRRWLALVIMLGTGVVTTMAFNTVIPGLPRIADHFKGGDSVLSAQFVLTMAPTGMAFAGLFAGLVIRRFGMRRTLHAGLALAALAGTAMLWVDNFYALLASRFLLGCAVVTVDIIAGSLLGARYTGTTRARLVGFKQAISSTGSVTIVLISGYLVQQGSWRTPGWLFLLAGVYLVIALFAFTRPIEQGDAAAVLPGHSGERFSVLQLWPVYLLSFLMTIAHAMPSFQMPFLLKENGVTDAVLISRVPALSAFVSISTAAAFGAIYGRLGRGTFVLSSLLMGFGFIGVGFAPNFTAILGCVVLEGIGAGLTQPYFTNRILDRITPAQRSQALGFLLSSVFIGHFFNPIVIAPLRNIFGIHTAFEVIGAALLVAAAGLALRATHAKSGVI